MNTFGSDNFSTVHPGVMSFLNEINQQGHDHSYDGDEVTEAARAEFKKVFGNDISVLFVQTGTGANIIGLQLLLQRSYETVISSKVSHIYSDESGAPSAKLGVQMLALPHTGGKILLEDIAREVSHRKELEYHTVLPKVVTIANATEYGTIYTPEEIRSIAEYCHANDMYLHLDGSRLSNAAASLGKGLKELTVDLGVDVVSFGGAKNGLMCAEAVVIFNAPPASLLHVQKQNMSLVSKMRYISGQFVPYLRDDLWLDNASHANQLAQKLAAGLQTASPEILLTQPVEINQIFCTIPADIKQRVLAAGHTIYDWEEPGEIRFVVSWDNSEQDVDDILRLIDDN